MKQLFLLTVLLSLQLHGQIEQGMYYSENVVYCDIWEGIVEHEKYNEGEYFYLSVEENGIRIFDNDLIGDYYPWTYIGMQQEYQTYLLSNTNKIVWSEDLQGILMFYDLDEDSHWYRKSIEYRDVKKVKDEKSSK